MKKTINQIIGGNIRRLRHDKKMSQQALGDIIKVSFQQMQKYEKGSNVISFPKAIKLAKFFDVPLEELTVKKFI